VCILGGPLVNAGLELPLGTIGGGPLGGASKGRMVGGGPLGGPLVLTFGCLGRLLLLLMMMLLPLKFSKGGGEGGIVSSTRLLSPFPGRLLLKLLPVLKLFPGTRPLNSVVKDDDGGGKNPPWNSSIGEGKRKALKLKFPSWSGNARKKEFSEDEPTDPLKGCVVTWRGWSKLV